MKHIKKALEYNHVRSCSETETGSFPLSLHALVRSSLDKSLHKAYHMSWALRLHSMQGLLLPVRRVSKFCVIIPDVGKSKCPIDTNYPVSLYKDLLSVSLFYILNLNPSRHTYNVSKGFDCIC